MSSSPLNEINLTAITTPYVNTVYAFEASGGFQVLRQFEKLGLRPQSSIPTYDVTNSVQIMLDVASFNKKLGLYKNATNDVLISSSFNEVDDMFTHIDTFTAPNGTEMDSIFFLAEDLREHLLTHNQIISVGTYSSLYTDFSSFVRYKFGFFGGISSLFEGASEFSADPSNNNIFNSDSLFKLIHGQVRNTNDSSSNNLTGYITINNITKTLRYIVDTNCFGNRTPTTIDENGSTVLGSGKAIDPVNKSNYGVEDGFIAGDLIFVPNGLSVSLNVKVDTSSSLLNVTAPQNTIVRPVLRPNSNLGFIGDYTSPGQTYQEGLNQVLNQNKKAHLLIKLVDASTIAAL
jgi:hypothetical protein